MFHVFDAEINGGQRKGRWKDQLVEASASFDVLSPLKKAYLFHYLGLL